MHVMTKIVVVNDDAAYLELLKDFLEDSGFEVDLLQEPDVTLQRIKALQPDLLIIDLIFGKEPSGWLILEHMHIDAEMKQIPILVCSAAVDQMHQHAHRYEGQRVAFLEKPFDLSVMLERIDGLLSFGD